MLVFCYIIFMTLDKIEKSSEEYKEYIIHDVLHTFDGVTARSMFGGYGLYLPDEQYGKIMFGGIANDQFFVRSDDEHKDYLVAEGAEQFIYTGHKNHKKPTPMPWWFVPEHILEDKDKLSHFVEEGFEIAKKHKK